MWLRLILLLMLPSMSVAGPWPREAGTTFVATSIELREDVTAPYILLPDRVVQLRFHAGLFIEYGLTDRFSIGASFSQNEMNETETQLHLGIGLWQGGPHTLSFELSRTETGAGLGLAYGRGFSLGKAGGWVAVEAKASREKSEREIKLDTTLGLSLLNDVKLMTQVFARHSDGETTAVLAPSIAIPLGPRNHLQIGARLSRDYDDPGLAIGLWQEF